MANTEVDAYIEQSHKWPEEMAALRPILLDAGLTETIKWGSPCFTFDGKNIAIFQEFNEFLSLMFFKGALLADPHGLLVEQGPNSRSARRLEFTSVADVARILDAIRSYIEEAIEVEREGRKMEAASELILVEELRERFDRDPALKDAFESLTPGRRREYNIYISRAKQAKTRVSRVDKLIPRILDGKGLRDR